MSFKPKQALDHNRKLACFFTKAILLLCVIGCGTGKQPPSEGKPAPIHMKVGQAIVGDGDEIANVVFLIGDIQGPVGDAFANAIANQKAGHPAELTLLGPNTALKPPTVLVPTVTIKSANQTVQLFGPVQQAMAKGVADAIEEGTIPRATQRLILGQ
ncbi:formaldehyde-activating enzyme [Zavarzinella formosa]|uniref:formaldehyde-activating enzyme n=1 Tax=Zavarzinella formosa TaxID=360055 RepID=UPI00037F9E71|nr:formaldehyde-activating enzyme [Zavarzinella formosa]